MLAVIAASSDPILAQIDFKVRGRSGAIGGKTALHVAHDFVLAWLFHLLLPLKGSVWASNYGASMCEDNVIRLPIPPVRGGPVAEDAEFVGREAYDIVWAMLLMIGQHISGYVMPLPIYGQPIELKRTAEDGSVVTTTYRLKF